MTYSPGDTVHAPTLRDRSFAAIRLQSVVSTFSVAPALIDVPGLSLTLRPNSIYAFDGWIGYAAGDVGDFALGFTGPPDCIILWNDFGLSPSATSTIGELQSVMGRVTTNVAEGFAGYLGVGGGSSNRICQPHGTAQTGPTGGSFRVQFAKNTESVGASAGIAVGSWLRVMRIPT